MYAIAEWTTYHCFPFYRGNTTNRYKDDNSELAAKAFQGISPKFLNDTSEALHSKQ